jgi:hypothetical protein
VSDRRAVGEIGVAGLGRMTRMRVVEDDRAGGNGHSEERTEWSYDPLTRGETGR